MSKPLIGQGKDAVFSEGNLTMGQVEGMFQRLVMESRPDIQQMKKAGKDAGGYIGRNFGHVVTYSDDPKASNASLRKAVTCFIDGRAPFPQGYRGDMNALDLRIGNNLVLILVRANNLENVGTDNEMPTDDVHATHWTVLNLTRNIGGNITIKYSDSLGQSVGKDKIPEAVNNVLKNYEIDSVKCQVNFQSTSQTAADCGYYAVWHALKMVYVNVEQDDKKFVRQQRETLIKESQEEGKKSAAAAPQKPKPNSAAEATKPAIVSALSSSLFDSTKPATSPKPSTSPKVDEDLVTELQKGRSLERDADDSSDDEDVTKFREEYSVEEAWSRFSTKKNLRDQTSENNTEESDSDEEERKKKNEEAWKYYAPFLMHAFGIGLLYSQEVGVRYYGYEDTQKGEVVKGLKEKYLVSLLDKNLLNEIVLVASDRTIKMFFGNVGEQVKKDFHAALATVLKKSDQFQSFVKEVSEGTITMSLQDGVLKIADSKYNDLFDVVADAIDSSIKETKGFDVKVKTTSNRATLFARGCNAVIPFLKKSGIIVDNESFSSKKDSPYKVADSKKDVAKDDKQQPNFPKKTYEVVWNLIKRKGKAFDKVLQEHEAEIAQAFFEDCAAKKSPLFQEQIRHNLEEQFLLKVRKDLPDLFQSERLEDLTGLLAHIRLSNRSATRKIKRFDLSSQVMADDYDDFYDIRAESSDTRVWNMSGVPVREKQSVDAEKSRVDLVFEADAAKGGKYAALHKKYLEFAKQKKSQGLNDKVFAKLIRRSLGFQENGIPIDLLADKDLKQFVAKVTYLIFGCEVARNPASLLANQMMLDLVISGNRTWKDFFVEERMPMSPAGAVAQARGLHSMFRDYMPWPYKYEGNEADPKDLMAAESQIFSDWMVSTNLSLNMTKEAIFALANRWSGNALVSSDPKKSGEIALNAVNRFLLVEDPSLNDYALLCDVLMNLTKGKKCELPKEVSKKIKSKEDVLLTSILIKSGFKIADVWLESEEEEKDILESASKVVMDKIQEKKAAVDDKNFSALAGICDPNFRNSEGESLFTYAACFGPRNLFTAFIPRVSNELICEKPQNGETALNYAIQKGWLEEAVTLACRMDAKSLDQASDELDQGALHYAIDLFVKNPMRETKNLIFLLLNQGADPLIGNGEGKNCLIHLLEGLNYSRTLLDENYAHTDLYREIFKASLRMHAKENEGEISDKTGISDTNFYNFFDEKDEERTNQSIFEEWEDEVRKELAPPKVVKPKIISKVAGEKTQGKEKS
jgi:hypothetical protein